MSSRTRPESPPALPVKIDSTTNGEYWPRPIGARLQGLLDEVLVRSGEAARRLAMSRRAYLGTTSAAAAVFLALNQLGCRGGGYAIPKSAPLDGDAARAALDGDELIFDVQTHHVTQTDDWWQVDGPNIGQFLKTTTQADCGDDHWSKCFARDDYVREVFLNSDTDLAVISALWGAPSPAPIEDMAETQERVDELVGKGRAFLHAGVYPNAGAFEAVRDEMADRSEQYPVKAWKLYPVWGPEGTGYFLDRELGQRTIAHGLEVGVKLFAVHKGLPLPGMDPKYTRPRDVGPAAREHPDATFLIYHSGYEDDRTEGPYDPKAERGVDALIRSVKEAELGREGNVYAELGSVWREVLKRPDEAAHVLGKLLVHFGEDRILWGTDGIWYGSPQDQIQAFRAFEISEEYQERFGYPALTPAIKAKIFGLNAARVYGVDLEGFERRRRTDEVGGAKEAWGGAPAPEPRTYGPKTRRQMLGLLRREAIERGHLA